MRKGPTLCSGHGALVWLPHVAKILSVFEVRGSARENWDSKDKPESEAESIGQLHTIEHCVCKRERERERESPLAPTYTHRHGKLGGANFQEPRAQTRAHKKKARAFVFGSRRAKY